MMGSLTICPHFLVDYPYETPAEIESLIIFPLRKCINKSKELGIPIVLSKEILIYHRQTHPWHRSADPQWKGYIRDWHTLISHTLLQISEFVSTEGEPTNEDYLCCELSEQVAELFKQFLATFVSVDMPRNLCKNAIFTNHICNTSYSTTGCYELNDLNNISLVKYPWLRMFDSRLPPAGERPFVPPSDWKHRFPHLKGSQLGYLDKNGHEWTWDRLHKNHWDVQEGGGSYSNVTPDGRIL